jgi:prenyltransferase beta subunit
MEVRREPEFFGEAELDLLYMARRLREALKLETLLTEAGLDYLVETGSYTGGFLMRRELTGAFFYVAPADLARARDLLLKNRYRPYQSEH